MVSASIVTVAAIAAVSVSANTLEARQGAVMDGVKGSVTNARQTINTLITQLQSHDGHPTSDIIGAVVTGLDSQIDNGIATIANTLAPLTGGLSNVVGNALLGPFAQSVTNGAEVVLSNVIGAPIDFVTQGILHGFANTLGNVAHTAGQYNIDTTRLSQISKQLQANLVKTSASQSSHHKRDNEIFARENALLNSYHAGMTNGQQTIDTLTRQLKTQDGHASADILTGVITGLDSQIDNGLATLSSALAPLTGGLSTAVGNFLLGPFFQSVTNGAEVVIGNLVGGAADLVASPIRAALSGSISNLVTEGNKLSINTTKLASLNNKLQKTLVKRDLELVARQGAIMDGVKGSVTNARQTINTLITQLQSHDGHPTSDIIGAVVTGLDSQIDNGIATIANTLAPLTGGLSNVVGNALLGPFAQSVTNGAEVVISNIIGAPVDFVTQGLLNGFGATLGNLAHTAGQYNVDTTRLKQLSKQFQSITKTH